jgi:hypothetical protein
MTTLIFAGVGAVVGFVVGILVGKRNPNKVNAAVAEANQLAKKL